jgi:hypothetical protein
MAARLSALRAGCFLLPERFLVIISVRVCVDPRAIVRLEGLGKLLISTSSGTGTGDLPACSIVPQPNTLPRAPDYDSNNIEIITVNCDNFIYPQVVAREIRMFQSAMQSRALPKMYLHC